MYNNLNELIVNQWNLEEPWPFGRPWSSMQYVWLHQKYFIYQFGTHRWASIFAPDWFSLSAPLSLAWVSFPLTNNTDNSTNYVRYSIHAAIGWLDQWVIWWSHEKMIRGWFEIIGLSDDLVGWVVGCLGWLVDGWWIKMIKMIDVWMFGCLIVWIVASPTARLLREPPPPRQPRWRNPSAQSAIERHSCQTEDQRK